MPSDCARATQLFIVRIKGKAATKRIAYPVPFKIIEALKGTGYAILFVAAFPFILTMNNCVALAQSLGIVSKSEDDDHDSRSPLLTHRPPNHLDTLQTPYRSCPLQNADEFRLLVISPASIDE